MAFVEFEAKGQVGVLTINRPEALNALNDQVISQLDQVLDAIDLETIRCVIVTGAGKKAFVAGADIAQMSGLTKAEGEAFGKLGNDVFRKLETLPVPTIAAVNGFALGGGCELCMSCDIRLASDTAVFGQPEVGLGITPGFGGTQRMARLIGMGKAKELIYTARNIKAPEALSIGLVQAVYPAEELMAEAEKMAARGLKDSGKTETAKVGYYNVYQNMLAAIRNKTDEELQNLSEQEQKALTALDEADTKARDNAYTLLMEEQIRRQEAAAKQAEADRQYQLKLAAQAAKKTTTKTEVVGYPVNGTEKEKYNWLKRELTALSWSVSPDEDNPRNRILAQSKKYLDLAYRDLSTTNYSKLLDIVV